MFKIGNIEINNKIVIAPLAGYTNSAYRRIMKSFGAGLVYTEMISAKGLIFDNDKTSLSFETKPFNGTTINGSVGDKQVELTMKTGFFSGYQLTGTIDGKEINISKGSDLSAAQGENDILTLVGSLMGCSYNVQDGKFGTLGLSEQAYIEQQQMMAIQQQQMFQQQMMLNNQMMGF